ncbi:hypothetical protein EUGRSUZ_H02352 [Eucalyptus grandis]|uniref:Uncharacterized protein n=2 Tax=Eucalyptus grandis TaxID=71139 RepID=A0ACC3JR84_EUCGR|nr:hypothetical protein EUGRSUZ_H02352 [Eucalyptus grandis]
MTNIEKPKFHILEDGTSNKKDKTNALIFIRRHLHESLQTQYLSVRDPHILWRMLKDRYDHTKTVILPQAQYDWQNLRLQDFKSGYKRRQEYNPRRDGKKFNRPRKSNFGLNHGKEKKQKKVINESICHRCGMIGHWSRTCCTPKHFVDLYQASLKNTDKRGESHAIEINPTAITIVEANNISVGGTPLAPEVANASLDVSDFFEDL